MGNGASNDNRARTERHVSRPHSAAAGAPRKQRVLANQAPRRSANSFRSPAAAKEVEATWQSASRNSEAKSMALQRVAAQRRAANHTEDDTIRAFTQNADPKSLRVLQLIQQADAVPQTNPTEKLCLLRQCYPLLEEVPKERFDQLAVTVYQQEGDIYYQQMDIQSAKDTFSRAITLAERRVARQDTDMYMVLKRYVLAMIGMARIWYDHERDHQGFKFVDHRNPKAPTINDEANSDDGNSSLSSLESNLSSDGGSIFSINDAILHSMAPRPPRRQTGPIFRRLKLKAPHKTKTSQYDREDEFVLHSRMTRELVASPCELLLLRCCEVVQIGHNAQSELLIPPQIELAQIYEDLALYSRALLLVRRCLGILCSVYDYDHPWVIQLMQRADRLKELLEDQLRNESATKIQSTWKMHKAMQALADALGHPVKRHQWIPRKYRATPDLDYLGDFVGDMPEDGLLGEDSVGPTEPDADLQGPNAWGAETEPPAANALVHYAPVEHREDGGTFTAMVPDANVVGTTQDTQTDTDVQHTEFGDVLTVRTTTVTKTITEDLVHSDEEQPEEVEEEEEGEDDGADDPRVAPLLPPPPQKQRQSCQKQKASPPLSYQQQQQRQQRLPLPPRHDSSPYDDNDEHDENQSRDVMEDEDDPYYEDYEYSAEEVEAGEEEPEYAPTRHPGRSNDGRRRRSDDDNSPRSPRREAPTSTHRPQPSHPKPQQRAKQTQMRPRGHRAGTQTRWSPRPQPSPPQSSAPPTVAPSNALAQSRRTTAGTQYEVASDTNSDGRSQHQLQQQPRQQPPPPRQRASPADNNGNDAYPGNDEEVEGRGGVPPQPQKQQRQHRPSSSSSPAAAAAPVQPYTPEVLHNFKREPLRHLVEPNERYLLDANGAPIFLPPLPYRAGLGSNGVPLPSSADGSGQLVVREPSRNGSQSSNGVSRPYDPRMIDPNAQPGSLMNLPSPANGYPRSVNSAPLPLSPLKKITRDHKIVKTRIVRTYRRGDTTESTDGTQTDDEGEQVFEHESGSSWETSGNVSWKASHSEASSSVRASTDNASSAEKLVRKPHGNTKKGPAMAIHVTKPKEPSAERISSGNDSPTYNAATRKPRGDVVGADGDSIKPEVVNSSVSHHVKHNRRSKTTTTVRRIDDPSEL